MQRAGILRVCAIALVAVLTAAMLQHLRTRRSDAPSSTQPNRLSLESSPYLRQHAQEPVDWYPWGDEAIARARRENKPILLSIGYASCHWCHVMGTESFADDEIATYLNANYVAVQVDREQRPDLDAVYAEAVRLMSGAGGWPLTVWLTPDLRPFFGGTYFPRRPADGAPGFREALERQTHAWRADRTQVDSTAAAVTARVSARLAPSPGDAPPGTPALQAAVTALERSHDGLNGGFGTAPKRPRPAQIDFLLRWYRRTAALKARDMALLTLDAMARGGIYDQVGGGFHRETVDAAWVVPHFEKMLPDNALLALAYLDALVVAPNDDLKEVTNHTLAWIRSMATPEGAFSAAIDADGAYYTWTFAELRREIDDWTWPFFTAYFPVTEAGDVGGANVLHAPRRMSLVARELGRDVPYTWIAVRAQLSRLRVTRARRPAPAVDRTVVAGWNGLAISALARSAQILAGEIHARDAARAAAWILETLRRDGRLARWAHDGVVGGEAMLEDYAFLIAGLLDLFEATSDVRWLREALALQDEQDARFHDAAAGGYFRTAPSDEHPLVREKPWVDGAEPSGNAVAARNLLRLAELTGDDARRERATGTVRAFASAIAASPADAPAMLAAVDFLLDRPKVVVVVYPSAGNSRALLEQVNDAFLPNRALVVVTEGKAQEEMAALVPLVAHKAAKDGLATAYVCEARECTPPITDRLALSRELGRVTPLP